MCNLYDIGPARRKPRTAFEAAALKMIPDLPQLFGIRKTDTGLVVTKGDKGYEARTMRWGFSREFNPAINNTRDDKLDNAMWRKAFREHRCLIPIAAFYEWTGPRGFKQTHVIRSPREAEWLWCAGLWEMHREFGPCYSMITTTSPPWMGEIHSRVIALFDELTSAADYLELNDPRDLLAAPGPLEILQCENPLKIKQPGPPIVMPRNQ
jgi:putative SOS response-associated peptidase YedK